MFCLCLRRVRTYASGGEKKISCRTPRWRGGGSFARGQHPSHSGDLNSDVFISGVVKTVNAVVEL